MLNSQEIASIIVSVLFVSTFICVFYFTYAVNVEDEVVDSQIDFIVKDLVNDLYIIPEEYKSQLKMVIQTAKPTDMTSSDESVEKNNKEIFLNAIKIVSIGFAVGMILVYLSSLYFGFSMKDILIKNSIILVFIGLTEFTFLSVFGRNYISADPNFVKYTLIDRLQQVVN